MRVIATVHRVINEAFRNLSVSLEAGSSKLHQIDIADAETRLSDEDNVIEGCIDVAMYIGSVIR